MSKVKTYNVMLSKVFPVTHPKAGEETDFKPKVMCAFDNTPCYLKKLHTIRANYDLWKKRIDEVVAGEAELCLRQWSGKPYRSKTVVIKRLRSDDGVGIQKLYFPQYECYGIINNEVVVSIRELANNDGISIDDLEAWFKDFDKSKPLAIIHFTNFRY